MFLFSGLLLFCAVSGMGLSQDLSEEQFVAESLNLRTALHYDPLLENQLESLVRLYGNAERLDELNGLYQAHVTQYPEDAGAKTVQIRILKKLKRPETDEQIAASAQQHPEFAALQYLLFQSLDEKADTRAAETLSRAIDLQTKPGRRSEWLEQLLQLTEDESGRALASAHLKKLLEMEGQSGESLMKLAGVMQRYLHWDLSLTALTKARTYELDPEAGIQADILSAKAESALGNKKQAGIRLDAVLGRLAADHWLRSEVMRIRIGVLETDAEKEAMLAKKKAAYEAAPEKDTAILEYVDLLLAVDRRKGAAEILLKGSDALPESKLIEEKTLELLRVLSDNKRLEKYLESKLERNPSLLPLRYELVKVRYALGKALDADQDFKAVLAALPKEKSSQRILDLARYLRSLKKPTLAIGYYDSFLKSNPGRLDVIRELAEVYLTQKNRKAAEGLLDTISLAGAKEENVLDLVQFLLDEKFLPQAQKVLSGLLSADPNQFKFAVLLVKVLGEIGDEAGAGKWIDQIRVQADTPARYSKWLGVALKAHSDFETADRFFDSEQNRFTFSDAEWTPERVEKFLVLCEEGEKRNLKERVSLAIRNQLAEAKLTPAAKVKLRQLLVRSLESNPSHIQETEEQLKLLVAEDPGRTAEYDLQLAVIYHRSNRIDLAQEILGRTETDSVKSVDLLRDLVPVMLEYGYLEMASDALAAITKNDPRDLYGWERRLSLLAAQGDEKNFREVIRTLLLDVKEVTLRDSSSDALRLHLMDSFWRSIAKILTPGGSDNLNDVFPLLDSVNRETPEGDRFWTEWTRAFLLIRLGREKEGREIAKQLLASLKDSKKTRLAFPDGLSISASTAGDVLSMDALSGERKIDEMKEIPFLDQPGVGWAFEVDRGAKLLRYQTVSSGTLVLDDRGSVYRIDGETGKLLWKENLGISGEVRAITPVSGRKTTAIVYSGTAAGVSGKVFHSDLKSDSESVARKVRSFLADDAAFFLTFGSEVRAYAVENCRLLWRAEMPEGGSARDLPSVFSRNALPETTLALGKEKVIVSDPVSGWVSGLDRKTGKMIWSKQILSHGKTDRKEQFNLFSLNCGISVAGDQVFVFGRSSAVLNLHTGEEIWRFESGNVRTFPIVLRKDRNESIDESDAIADAFQKGDRKESWKHGNVALNLEHRVFLLDHLTQGVIRQDATASFFKYPTSLVAPAVHWAEDRVNNGVLADAQMGNGFLWLMGRSGVRRVSLSLPLASAHFPVQGSFLGETKNHAWFLDNEKLIHADYKRKRLTQHSLVGLGRGEELRGLVHGAQVLVSGEAGLKVFHATTGQAVAEWAWPKDLSDYLKSRLPRPDTGTGAAAKFVWQGLIRKSGKGQVKYLYPVLDSIRGSDYFTVFDQSILVSLKGKTGLPKAADN